MNERKILKCNTVIGLFEGTLEEVANGARDESKFIAIYDAVVDFIEWHNNQNK